MEAGTIAAMATATAAMRGRDVTGVKGRMNCRGIEKRLLIGRAHGRS